MNVDCISDSFKKYNEDICGMTENSFWVLDGASALNYHNYTDEENDVYWVVNWWNRYLRWNIDNLDRTIIEILEEGVLRLNDEFKAFVDFSNLSKLDRVSSGIAVLRVNGKSLECFVLGDVEINLKFRDKECLRITDSSIEELDNEVIKLMAEGKNRQEHLVFKGFTQRELDLLRINRSKMNSEDGYYILEHDPTAVRKGIYQEHLLDEIEDILLISDGYAQLYKRYSLPDLFEVTKKKGLEKMIEELRAREDEDCEMRAYKRLKKHDDATAIIIEV